jgi:hypothetical protein
MRVGPTLATDGLGDLESLNARYRFAGGGPADPFISRA